MRSESRSKGLRNGSANESVSCVSLQLKPTEMAGLSALVCLSPQHPCRERGGGDLRISRKLMDSSLGVCGRNNWRHSASVWGEVESRILKVVL